MAVGFILGRSGTGKTSYCIDAVVGALVSGGHEPLILLVPEQATYQAERAILTDKRIAGYNRLHVLSFDRLQFLLSGKNAAKPAITHLGRSMIIHKLLRDNSDKLGVFNKSANLLGLGQQMAQTITELHQYAKTPDDIEQLLEKLQKDKRDSLAALKFADIGLIFREYLKFIEDRFTDPDMELLQSRRAVAEAKFVKDAKLWVDGFASFTESELAVLTELLKVTKEAKIALCLDPAETDLKNIDDADLFGTTRRTYSQLVGIIKESKLKLTEPETFSEFHRFASSKQLEHIERNIFEPKPTKIKTGNSVRIISAPNQRSEAQFVARQILKLVKEKALRYRDIAVIASDIDSYRHYIKAYFEDYSIPFFIDKRKPLNQHPAVGLICSALQVVTEGFSHSDIFAYLKNDLVPAERCEVDLLENYCLAFGIAGNDWKDNKDWSFDDKNKPFFDEKKVNQVRKKVLGPLLKLHSGDETSSITSEKFKGIIFDFIEQLGVRQKITSWIEEGDGATADEHRQFYDKFVKVFGELLEVFGGIEMNCADYFAIINSAFAQLELAFIPPTLDQVIVGSIERSRHPDLKAVFLIGTTQKQFPVPVGLSGILTDDDRVAAEAAEFSLAATLSQKLAERQYLAYIAFTRASQFLYVTYPLADDKASATARSQFIENLESLFEGLKEESTSTERIGIENIHSEIELTDLLCSRLGKDATSPESGDGQLEPVLDSICSDKELADSARIVQEAINYDNIAELDKQIIGGLFGKQVKSSATRLSSFASCPYQYFARYILGLKERKEFKFEPLDVGNFYHRILDGLLKKLNAAKKDLATIEDKELLEILSEQIQQFIQTDSFISNFVRHSRHNAYIINSVSEVLEKCVLTIARMVRAGSFRPVLSEASFGEASDVLGEYKMKLSSDRELFLRGKIDRLDIDGEKAAIVFDYKRKDKTFSWTKFYYGLDMQLGIYMLAVANSKKAQPVAGAFYMPVEVGVGKSRKAKGIFNGKFAKQLDEKASKDSNYYNFFVTKDDDEPYGHYGKRDALKPGDFEKVLRFAEKKIVRLAEDIVSGRIDVKPYRIGKDSPCSYCKYRSVCRFDWLVNEYDILETIFKPEVLEKMGAVDG
ncbi:MAG: exodeoxyribonuclease V subunit gamma [Planctomycetes bacterium]|nr:exodeoxyribonuclease V subunit gamma [Planctomycetota bacterium]